MKDRIPLHAGRVQLVPVSGNLYDMTMADDPTEAGTPLNKANLLSDAAAQAVWPNASDRPSDPVPSEAFIAMGEKCRILLDYIAEANITQASPTVVTLAGNVEDYRMLEIWGYTTSTLSQQGDLQIDVGESVDSNKRLTTYEIQTTYCLYSKVFIMANTDADGHVVLDLVQRTSTGHPIGAEEYKTGTGKLTGNKIALSSTTSQSPVRAGLHIVIIGYKL